MFRCGVCTGSDRKRRSTTALALCVVNPIMRRGDRAGHRPARLRPARDDRADVRTAPPHARGERAGRDTFWIVAEHGRSAAYVRNLQADPRVRVEVGRTWRTGTAALLPDDDARERQRSIGRRFNAAVVRLMGTDLFTVRVGLEPSTLAGNDRKRNS